MCDFYWVWVSADGLPTWLPSQILRMTVQEAAVWRLPQLCNSREVIYSRGQLLRTSFRKNFEKNSKMARGSKCELRTRNQNDGVLSSHLEPLSTRYLEPPPCFLFCHFVFMRVFQHFFIYMPKIQKGYLLQSQPYPWWTLYLEPPFCIRFGRLHQDEIRDMMKKRDMMCCVSWLLHL